MRYGVSRGSLIIIAGAVWTIAGSNVLYVGIYTWLNQTNYGWWGALGALIIFLIFFFIIFRRFYKKHTTRIGRKTSEKNNPLAFFDMQGWIVMLFMIALGNVIRHFNILSPAVLSAFYIGLSSALLLTGLQFIRYGWIFRQTTYNKIE